jgi:acyl-CoA thioester hydrolase
MDRTDHHKLSDFALISEDKIRYCDTDKQGHVNNAVFSSFFETGRVDILYNESLNILDKNCSFVIASIKLDYIEEINWPGKIYIGTKILKIGNSSLILNQGLYQNENCVAIAETVIVQVNKNTKKSSLISEEAKELLKQYMKTE